MTPAADGTLCIYRGKGRDVEKSDGFLEKYLYTNIPHSSCRVIINGAKVSMAIYQGCVHRKVLGQAHESVVHCSVSMRVELA